MIVFLNVVLRFQSVLNAVIAAIFNEESLKSNENIHEKEVARATLLRLIKSQQSRIYTKCLYIFFFTITGNNILSFKVSSC